MAVGPTKDLASEATVHSAVLRIASLLFFSAFFSLLLWGLYIGWHGIWVIVLRLALNAFLGWNLAAGYRWARWAVVVRCAFGVFMAVPDLIHLPDSGVPHLSVLGFWAVANIAMYTVIGLYLVFSPRMQRHFDYSDASGEE